MYMEKLPKKLYDVLYYVPRDLPAGRKLCGFLSYKAHYGCSRCLKFFLVQLVIWGACDSDC